MYETVIAEIGKPIVFNICMLGTVIAITGLVNPESVMKALQRRIPADFLDLNRKALDMGIKLGEVAKNQKTGQQP